MKVFLSIISIILAAGIASLADTVATLWANSENKFSIYLLGIIVLGPFVFIAFGYVTTKTGLAMASGLVNSLLVISSILVGLFFFDEWHKISSAQFIGILFAVFGMVLMLFTKRSIS